MHLRKGRKECEKGAITVFLAIIFMSIMILAGTVIDIVRIEAAERKVQSALNSSARSVLADYDIELAGSYGIYGVGTASDTIEDDLYKYLLVNLKEYHEGVNFLNIKVDREDIAVQGMDSLLSEDAFKVQVQEYMKYRTPIIVAQNLIEQLENLKLDKKIDFVECEKTARSKARELRTKANDVNAKLTGIKNKLRDLSAEKLENLRRELEDTLTASGTIFNDSGNSLMDEYIQSRDEANEKAREGGFTENLSQEFEDVIENSEDLTPELQKLLKEVKDTIAIVTPLKKELEDMKEELSDLEDRLAELEEDEGASPERLQRLEDRIEQTEDAIDSLESRIDEQILRLKAKAAEFSLEGFCIKDEAVQAAGRKIDELKDKVNLMKSEIEKILLKRLEKEWLIGAAEFNVSMPINSENFEKMDDKAVYDYSMGEEEAERHNDTILQSIERLSKAVSQATAGAAEKVNTIEYVMDRFTFLTSKTERNHYFKKGEVEYIISGKDIGDAYNPLMNTEYCVVTNVLLQVWALRFAIDTIDNFVRSVVVFPPQRLAFALVEGALDSSLDMYNMLNGEAVSLSPDSLTGIKLKYSDHLKILLLMRSEEEILRKARQLMQVNIGQVVDPKTGDHRENFRLGNYSTVISARAEAKLNLFFLPLLKVDKLMPGSFEEGRYVIRKQIYVGY